MNRVILVLRWSAMAPLCIFALLSLGACSTDRSHSPGVTRLANGICTTETPIGSHRPKQVCRSNAQIEAEKKQAQHALNKVRNTPNSPVPRS